MGAALRRWWAWSFCAATYGALAGAPAVARAEWETRDLGGTSTHVYTPASSSPIGRGRALLVVLHGCSQLASTLRDHGNFEGAAEGFGFVIDTGGTDDAGAGASGSATDGDGGSTSDAGATADPDATPSGCQCGAPGSRPRGLGWAWVGLGLVALGRRRA